MRRLPRYRQTWAIRTFLAIACITTVADWSLAQQTVFNESVVGKWHEYEEFSRSIQAKARITVSGLEPGTAKSYPAIYKQNRQCAMYCNNMGWDEPTYEFCMIANPRYSAEIKRNVSDHSNTLLRDYKEDPNAIFPLAGQLFDKLFADVSPHFAFYDVRISDVVFRPSFKVNGVSKEMRDGEELVRIDHSYVYDLPQPPPVKRQYRLRGSILFDPARCWCIRQIKESEEFLQNGSIEFRAEVNARYEVADHPSGFPIIKSKSFVRTGYSEGSKEKFQGTVTTNYETEINKDVSNDEFTLSAFGLPEPSGMEPVKKPIPLYIWILLAAGTCGVIALVFRHLARRWRLAAAA